MAEGLVVASIVVSPWYYGCAPDVGRYVLGAVLAVAAAAGFVGGVRTRIPGVLALPALGLLQLLALTTVAPIWTVEAVLLLAAMLAALTFVAGRASDPRVATRIAAAVLFAALAQGAFGAYAWSVGPRRLYGVVRPDVTMPFGSFVNHNHFAGFIEMAALLALGMAAGHARRARQLTPASVGLFGIGLALAAAHLASQSRGGLVALAAGVLFCAGITAATWRSREAEPITARRLAFASLAALVVLGFGLVAVSPSARSHLATLRTAPTGSSGSYRIDTAWTTLRLFAERPLLGAGLGAYEDAIPRHKRGHGEVRTTHAESDALEWLAEGGVVGFAALGWLGWALIRRFLERLAEGRDAFRKGIAIGAASGVVALAVHSFIDFNLRIPSNALLFVVLLGLACARPSGREAETASLAGGRLVPAVLVVLAAAGCWRAWGAWEIERVRAASDTNARLEALDRVIRWHPYIAEAWRERGLAWRELGSAPTALRRDRLQRAVSDLSHAIALRPAWGVAWVDRGWARGMLGDLDLGARDIAAGAHLDPTHPGIRLIQAEFHRGVPPVQR